MVMSPDHPSLTFVQAKEFGVGRAGKKILWIVVHDMEAGEYSGRAESTANYFATLPDDRVVSSHYTVDDDSVVQCVLLKDTAYTVGNTPGNQQGINWELSGFARQTREEWLDPFGLAMFNQMAPIVRADAAKEGIPLEHRTVAELQALVPGLTSHNDLREAFGGTTHTDPGPNFPWDVFLEIVRGEEEEEMSKPYLIIRDGTVPAPTPAYALFGNGATRWIGPREYIDLTKAQGVRVQTELAADAMERIRAARVDVPSDVVA